MEEALVPASSSYRDYLISSLKDYEHAAQQHYEKLNKILAETGGEEILTLIEFLNALGYRIALGAFI